MNNETPSAKDLPTSADSAAGSARASGRERWVRLSDGRLGLRRGLVMEIREPSDPPPATTPSLHHSTTPHSQLSGTSLPILDFIASDETLDRYDERIVPSGWRLESYRRNPVFQNAHQYGDVLFTLGKAVITEVRSASLHPSSSPPLHPSNSPPLHPSSTPSLHSYLFQRIQFATDVNPIARIAYGLYKGKFLNAVSVGFIPLRWEDGDNSLRAGPGESAWRTHLSTTPSLQHSIPPHCSLSTPRPRRLYLEQELLEVSAVAIPANPNALALGLKTGVLAASDLRDSLELLRALCRSLEFQTSSTGPGALHAGGTDPYHALMLARALREVLKRA
jgi:hypothetical protein